MCLAFLCCYRSISCSIHKHNFSKSLKPIDSLKFLSTENFKMGQSSIRESTSGVGLSSFASVRWKLTVLALTWNRKTKQWFPSPRFESVGMGMSSSFTPSTPNQLSLLCYSLPLCYASSQFHGNLEALEKLHCASGNFQSPQTQNPFIRDKNYPNFMFKK